MRANICVVCLHNFINSLMYLLVFVFDWVVRYAFQITGKSVAPKSTNDMKLIHAGKVLENSKTLSESRVHVGDLAAGVITMHVVVQPVVAKKKSGLYSILASIYVNKVFAMYKFFSMMSGPISFTQYGLINFR